MNSADRKDMVISAQELQYKRKFPRRRFKRAVGYLLSGDYFLAEGDEIGEGGMSLILEQEISIERELVLSFQLPGGSFVCVRAEVRNCWPMVNGRYSIGCLFKNMKFDRKREIRAYVSARPESEH
jgi:hypothetical protein